MAQSIPGRKDTCMKTESLNRRVGQFKSATTILQAALAVALYTIGLAPNAFAQDAQPAQQFAPPPVETDSLDVNGDGVQDLLVAIPTMLNDGEARFSIVAYGGATEDGGELFTIVSPETSDMFGVVTTRAGDLDGDDREDFLVSAPASGDPLEPSGKVYAYASGDALDPLHEGQPVLWTFAGQPGEMLGQAVAPIGDITGDGRMDFAIGSIGSNAESEDSGRVYVLSGVNGAMLYAIDGGAPNQSFGYSIAGLGDVNGDGVPDFAVGAPAADRFGNPAGAGQVTIHSGADGALIRNCASPEVAVGDGFGAAIASIGDVTGDSVRDFVATAPGIDKAFGFSGADCAPLYTLSGAPGERFGFRASPRSITGGTATMVDIVSILPDADGDGVPESRSWVFRADTGDLLFVEDDEGNAVAPLSTDVDADGLVTMTDTAMVIETMGDNTTSSRTDVNGDGLIDDADMITTLESLGSSGPSASLTELEPCDEHAVDFPECGDLSLDDPMVGCDCAGDGGGDGGGGAPPQPGPEPDWDGFLQCQQTCMAAFNISMRGASRFLDRGTLSCLMWAAPGGLVGGILFNPWWGTAAGATGAYMACMERKTDKFIEMTTNAEITLQLCILACETQHNIP